MVVSNENTLPAESAPEARSDGAKADAVKASAAKRGWTKIFNAVAGAGELFFDALKTLVKYFVYGILWLIAAFLRGWARVSKLFKKLFAKVRDFVTAPFKRYKKALKIDKTEISRAASEKGVLGGAAAGAKVAGRVLFGKRGVIISVINWVLPVVSCVFLFNIISYANSQTYALKLTVNGDFIGYISDESAFASAEKMVQKRINYTGSRTEVITFEPAYEVGSIGYGDTLNIYQTADKLLELISSDIKKGYGLYIGDAYFGTLEEHDAVDAVLADLLDQYRTGDLKETVEFDKEITYIEGKYMNDSFVDEDDMIATLTSKKQTSTYYTIESGDSPALIAQKVDMSFDELDALNPGFSTSDVLYTGERVYITREVPFLSVVITREEHYTESVPFETETVADSGIYEGDQITKQTGVDGEEAVVANVSYINGIEVSRNVISTTITTEPITQIMRVGTQERPADAGPSTTVPEGQFYWPVGGYGGGTVTCEFGGYLGHKGLDIHAGLDTPIYAAASGTVIDFDYSGANAWNSGMGNYVKILHDNGFVTIYQHLNAVSSSIYVGKRVTMAEPIGYMGRTGNVWGTTGIHLHFEVQYGGVAQNPRKYLPAHY